MSCLYAMAENLHRVGARDGLYFVKSIRYIEFFSKRLT